MGEKLLTTGNPDVQHDHDLFRRLDLHPMQVEASHDGQAHDAGTVHADILEPPCAHVA
jgi:biotin synthase